MTDDRDIREFSLIHELVYQLKVRDAMTRNLYMVGPRDSMRLAQQVLREKRISGLPVVDNNRLLGIISVEDIIRALDLNHISAEIGDYMTRKVITLRPEYTLAKALNIFNRYPYGRFPVTDADGQLVGILTQGDITRRLMFELNSVAEQAAVREAQHMAESIAAQPENKVGEFLLEATLKPGDFDNAGILSNQVKKKLQSMGIEPEIVRRAAIACYEAETNLIIHTLGGTMTARIANGKIIMEARDIGPGIPDIQQAMSPGFSTASDSVRALGFGAGMGLPNIKKCADKFEIQSEMGLGTHLKVEIELKMATPGQPDNNAGKING
jgi:CBS domain-containing protein/anti-sigma regulatory factor (Ser/Thr protein kinase)